SRSPAGLTMIRTVTSLGISCAPSGPETSAAANAASAAHQAALCNERSLRSIPCGELRAYNFGYTFGTKHGRAARVLRGASHDSSDRGLVRSCGSSAARLLRPPTCAERTRRRRRRACRAALRDRSVLAET